jgi:Coenzyme PQQ synthesis protein D (PqqD)
MNPALYIARNSAVAARKLGGEMMIMSGRTSTLFTLDETATIIWESASGSLTLAEIVASKICTDFDVEYACAVRDAEAFAEALAVHGILLISRDPIHDKNLAAGLLG